MKRPLKPVPILGFALLAAAILAAPAAAQLIESDLPLVQVVGQEKERLLRAIAAQKRDVQTFSPSHHECPNDTPHVQPIACGESITDALTQTGSCVLNDNSFIDFYGFNGTAGQQVTINMSSSVFDTYLFLIDGNGTTVLAENDDIQLGVDTNSRIVFTLTTSGTFFIGANSFDPNQFGTYALSLACAGGGPGACTPNATTLCLNNGRFRVTATFLTNAGQSGNGQAVSETTDTGMFWFFSANNIEVIIKVVNACSLGRYWVFAGGLTDVQVVLTVVDTANDTTRTYMNPQGTAFAPIQDTNAFATCP